VADITKITASIQTADVAYAPPSNGRAYLCVAGREFLLAKDGGGDKRQGSTDTYAFGEGGNVTEAHYNDPRFPQLTTQDLDRYPIYIRFTGNDGWCIERAWVNVTPGGHEFDNYALQNLAENRRIWLREDYGQHLHLTRIAGTPDSPAPGASPAGSRLVWGNIAMDGAIKNGSGDFTVARQSAGRYVIDLQQSFGAPPGVTAAMVGEGWSTLDNVHLAVVEAGRIIVVTGDSSGSASDRPFSFHACAGS
jgi:hypothetical protein